ncbi:Ig-like domain-containing protein [Dehalococcoidia bacterium]|nr:Ig-like domain-containing protein [Dehalococcoidia bacterium]
MKNRIAKAIPTALALMLTMAISTSGAEIAGASGAEGKAIALSAQGLCAINSYMQFSATGQFTANGRANGVVTATSVADSNIAGNTAAGTAAKPESPPVVEITSPIDEETLSGVVKITGTVYDANLRDYRLYVTPRDDWMWKLGCYGRWMRGIGLIELSTYSVSDGVLGVLDTTGLPDGNFALRLRARDTEDNRDAIDPISVRIDNGVVDDVSPVVEITLPAEGETVSGTISIDGTVNDDNLWRYRIRAISIDGWWRACAGCGDAPVIEGQLTPWDTTRVPDGNYTIRVYAADLGGNVAVVPLGNITVDNVVDDVMPVAELTFPLDGETISGTVEVLGTASDENIWMYVIWTFDADGRRRHAGFARGTSVTTDKLSSWDTTGFNDGEYLLELHVTDWGGNTNIVRMKLTIDNVVEDSITIDPIAITLNITDTQQFTATVGPEGADQRVTWTVDDAAIASIDADGLFTAKAAGTVNITAISVANPNITGTALVTVVQLDISRLGYFRMGEMGVQKLLIY